MLKGFVTVLAVLFQVANSQGPEVPAQCRGPPGDVGPQDCCKLPEIFSPEDFEECGFKRSFSPRPPRVGHDHPDAPRNCSREICIMRKYEMLKEDDSVDFEAFAAKLLELGDRNPTFKESFEMAKNRCVANNLVWGAHTCQQLKAIQCVTGTLIRECPIWLQTKECLDLQQHFKECSPYFRS